MRSVRQFVFAVGCACTLLAPASTARAGFNATFTGADPMAGVAFTYFAAGSTGGSGTGETHISAAGRMDWSTTDPAAPGDLFNKNGQSNGAFVTFCIDVSHWVQGTQTFTVLGSSSLPSYSNALAHFWAQWADVIKNLDPNAPSTTLVSIAGISGSYSNDQIASALQLAIWEIVYDVADSNGNYDVTSGSGFRVTSPPSTDPIVILANGLVNPHNWTSGNVATLLFLQSGHPDSTHGQDQVTGYLDTNHQQDNPTPVPPGVVLALTGLLPCLAFRRRLAGRPAVS